MQSWILNVSAEIQNQVGCFSSVDTIELQKHPALLDISPHSSAEILPYSGNCGITESRNENINEQVVALEVLQGAIVPEISNVEHEGMAKSPISINVSQDQSDNILLTAEPKV
ncbi:hypothetical protein QYM36_015113 [Artemia franciscana]|uniref:Uncharacterized protein n=1 Tax=Artemia franciscana TaxID=6661 RepID=A0AA88H9B7_ARTSF|nr:hypothetical protein QYM36_015113 [Artemia franciscana]